MIMVTALQELEGHRGCALKRARGTCFASCAEHGRAQQTTLGFCKSWGELGAVTYQLQDRSGQAHSLFRCRSGHAQQQVRTVQNRCKSPTAHLNPMGVSAQHGC